VFSPEARPPKEEETFSAYPYSEWLFSSGQDLPRADEFIGKGSYRCNLRMTWRVLYIFCKRIRGRHGCCDLLTTVSNIFNDPQMTKELSSILFCHVKGNLNKSISFFSIELKP